MDKNVSGVDLEELLKAREELDRERGVATDPNMYSDYNSNRAGEKNVTLENSNSVGGGSDEPGASQDNLSKLGAFSAFEVKDNANDETHDSFVNVPPQPKPNQKVEAQQTSENLVKNQSSTNISDVLEKEINDLIEEIDLESESEEQAEEPENDDKNNEKETEMLEAGANVASIDVEPKLSQNDAEALVDSSENLETLVESAENLVENGKVVETSSLEPGNETIEDVGVITDFNQLKEILQNELKESENAIKTKQQEPQKQQQFAEIEDFKFINEIATDEFKTTDKFSYIMGKRENGSTIYGNLKEHLNLAVFGKNDQIINSFLNSMILCMCLKNSYHDVNFALLDSNIDSSFEVYNKSSYLYFNRIAKTNKEIRDTLIEISKEVDGRYDKLAGAGVKTIEEYNTEAAKSGLATIPYIIVVFNNYTSASQATDNDKINACLYQILKFGRIAGIYCVVSAKLPIENSQVNYNLSSRISFKGDTDSRYTIGEAGSDALKEDNDALYFNISSGVVEHIKTAKVTDNELELIIKDLEE